MAWGGSTYGVLKYYIGALWGLGVKHESLNQGAHRGWGRNFSFSQKDIHLEWIVSDKSHINPFSHKPNTEEDKGLAALSVGMCSRV